MYIDALHYGDTVFTWCRDANHQLRRIDYPAPYECYQYHPHGELRSIFGDPVRKSTFPSREALREHAARHDKIFESDIAPLYKSLSTNFHGMDTQPVHVGYFDIETDYDLAEGKGYPIPENPFGEIIFFSLFDKHKQEYHMVMNTRGRTVQLKDEEFPVHLHYCNTERELIDTFLDLIRDIDLITAWNGDGYDIPYIVQRMRLIFGTKEADKRLCRDGFKMKQNEVEDDFGNKRIEYTLVGRVHLDMLRLYKNFTFGERPSYKLDAIADEELKMKKLSYVGDLGDLYRNDIQTYAEYSLHDARLLLKLDNKMKLTDLAISMARQATILLPDVFGSIKYIEMAIRNYCHHIRKDKLVLPDKKDNTRESFEGGFVFEPKVGAHRWSTSIDLTSLYPSVMRALNISPETHVLQLRGGREDWVRVVHQEQSFVDVTDVVSGIGMRATAKEIWDLIVANNLTISANGSIFRYEEGIIPEILTVWFKERKDLKKKAQAAKKAGNYAEFEFFDMRQALRKLALNSTYGALSNIHCRFFSLDLAKSVTLTGQEVNKHQAYFADNYIKKKVLEKSNVPLAA